MVDKDLIEQIKIYMQKLEKEITFKVSSQLHEKRDELLTMLKEICETSNKLSIKIDETEYRSGVSFEILLEGQSTGIIFSGVPGGHEFNSLILAIIQASTNSIKIDDSLKDIIKNIKNPLKFETVISLSCHNCPDVVQTLNQMAILNPLISNEMIDGGLFPELIAEKKIQGVPTIFLNDEVFYNGKIELSQILELINQKFPQEIELKYSEHLYDSVVIGGGPAGISASIYIARKGLQTLMIADKIGGQVQDTNDIENMISKILTTGHDLSHDLEKHLEHYQIETKKNLIVKEIQDKKSYKEIYLNSGEVIKSKSVVIATGAKWKTLGVPGEKGVSGIAFCVNCDGPFYKDKHVVVVGGGNSGIEAALDLVKIVKHVTVLEFMPVCKADKILIDRLIKHENVNIVTNAHIQEIENRDGKVSGVIFTNRETNETNIISTEGVFIQIGLTPNSDFVKDLLETNKFGEILIDAKCKTNIEGIFAAGDVTNVPYKQIVIGIGEGAKAGISVADYIKTI